MIKRIVLLLRFLVIVDLVILLLLLIVILRMFYYKSQIPKKNVFVLSPNYMEVVIKSLSR